MALRLSPYAKRLVHKGLLAILGLIALSTLLSVNLFPVITNDSLTYLGYSRALSDFGWVEYGYRQFGYPVFLAIATWVADLLTIEPLLFVVFAQRVTLALGLVYAIWLWRWWSIPIVLFGLTAEIVAYTDLILTEGMSIPLALILACLTTHFFKLRTERRLTSARALSMALIGGIAAVTLSLVSIRFPFAVLGVCPLVVAIAGYSTSAFRPACIALSVYVLGVIGMVGLLGLENEREVGEFSPTTRTGRSAYWATWHTVFSLVPDNASDLTLADYYDGGDPYVFISEVDSMNVTYREQALVYNHAINDLLAAAEIGVWQSRIQSLMGALSGGRIDDIAGIVEAVKTSDRVNVDKVSHSNAFSREHGALAFADQFNDGKMPEAVIIAPLALSLPLPTAPRFAALITPVALATLLWGFTHRVTRLLAAGAFVAIVVYSASVGYIRADNFRFVATITIFGVAVACGVAALRLTRSLNKPDLSC